MVTRTRGGLIERAEVGTRIASALEQGSVVLVAGAGYGKTTALRQALERTQAVAAWVRCGDATGDPGRLLGLLVDAVSDAVAGAADALAEQLARAREPVDPGRAALVLARELAAVLVEPLVIVFDDAETIAGAPAALEVIARLLADDSELLRVAVATRRRLATRLARRRAMGQITELGPSDLAFSAAECTGYLRQSAGREPLPDEIEELLEATAGWPLGVALAASTGQEPGAGPSPALADEYFAEEVYAPLDPAIRQALAAASTAPDLQVAEQAGLAPPGGFAAAIEHYGLLVGGAGRELHPLFREFLRSRFAAEAPVDQRRATARDIASVLDSSGQPIEAIDYHLAAEDWQLATVAIVREGSALVRSAPDTVSRWLEALPADAQDHPEVTLLAGELAHGEGRFDDAVGLCRSAVERLEAAAAPAPQRFTAYFALADVLMAVGDLAGAAELAAVLDDAEARGNLAARGVAVVAAAGLARAGRFKEGESVLRRALDDPVARPLAGVEPTFAAFYLDLPAGRLDEALEHAHDGVALLEASDPMGRLPYALAYLMAILEERGEDAEALAVSEKTRALVGGMGLSGWVGAQVAIRSASLRARAGDVAGAEADLARVAPGWRAWGAWELETARAAIAAIRGDAPRALAAAERALREAKQRWPYFEQVRCAALVAPVLSSCGQLGQTRKLVERTIQARPPGFSTARLYAVLAWLLHDEGDEPQSIHALASAWAEAGDQVRHLVRREWPRIQRPLWVALEHGALDLDSAIAALSAVQPGGQALGAFTHHPVAEVRRAALLGAVAAGHPEGIARVPELRRDPDPQVADAARVAGDLLVHNPPALAFRLLGRFELRRGAWLVEDSAWERRVAQRLIRFLLCRGGGPVPEDELIEAFWPDKPPASARRSVQVAVSAARAVLDPPGVQHSRLLCSERTYRLVLRVGDTIDADEFERAARAALVADARIRPTALAAAAALWGGEPLPEERYAEWATPWREPLIDRYGEVLAALSDAHEQAGDQLSAVDVARQLVELDPLNEAAHRRLIVAFARSGRRGHALRQFLACRRALVTELGVEPSAETAALQRRVLAGERV